MGRLPRFLAPLATVLSLWVGEVFAGSIEDYATVMVKNLPKSRDLQASASSTRRIYESATSRPGGAEFKLLCDGQPPGACAGLAATAQRVAQDGPGCGIHYASGWLPAPEVNGGPAHIDHLSELAKDRTLFDCASGRCLAIARLRASNGRADVQDGIGVCSVAASGTNVGAPEECKPLVARWRDQQFIRVITGEALTACSMGMPDFDLAFWSQSQIDRSKIDEAIISTLSSSPFNLSVTQDAGLVTGTRAQLVSEVLTPFREWVTIRVDILEGHSWFLSSSFWRNWTTLRVSSTILVNRQNTSGRTDWTAPSEGQEKHYLEVLRTKLRERTAAICAGGKWHDSQIYNCDLPSGIRPGRP